MLGTTTVDEDELVKADRPDGQNARHIIILQQREGTVLLGKRTSTAASLMLIMAILVYDMQSIKESKKKKLFVVGKMRRWGVDSHYFSTTDWHNTVFMSSHPRLSAPSLCLQQQHHHHETE